MFSRERAQKQERDEVAERLASHLARLESRLDALDARLAGAERPACQPNYVDRGTQQLLAMQYCRDAASGILHDFEAVEFRNHSQNGEDGILHYVFSLIGTTSKYVVEMCAGDGRECNAANLVINHGWHALLCDGDEENIRIANEFYWTHPDTRRIPPAICQAWLTAENVNEVISRYGFDREIDLLSLDVDGNDYWLWKAMTAANPRVVMLEIQPGWMADAAVTVPYDPGFCVRKLVDAKNGLEVDYHGASLPAMVKLGREKGYRLVGSNRYGFNVVFVRNDVGAELLPEVPAEHCFRHPVARWRYGLVQPLLRREAWVEV